MYSSCTSFRTYFVRHGCLFDVLLTLQFVPTTVFLIRDYTLIKKCLFLLWIKFIKPMILENFIPLLKGSAC